MTRIHEAPTKILEPTETRYDHSYAVTHRTCQKAIPDGEGGTMTCGKPTKGYSSKGNWNQAVERQRFFCYQHRDKPKPLSEPWGKCVKLDAMGFQHFED